MTSKTLTICLTLCICLLEANALKADFLTQGIKNVDPVFTGDDLTLVFTKPVTEVIVADPHDGKSKPLRSSGTTTVHFAKDDLGSAFGPGDAAGVGFNGPPGTTIDKNKSEWSTTTPGGVEVPIVGSVASLGAPPTLTVAANKAFAKFTNPESSTILYTDIRLYADNDLTNFNISAFTTPTGSFVGGIPSSILLAPGASVIFSFGAISANTYQLALADAAFASLPGDTFSVAAASAVPEPSTLIALTVGFLVLGLAYKPSH